MRDIFFYFCFFFPKDATQGGEPGQVWMRVEGDLFIPHRTEAAVLALPLTEMNEFNMVPLF